MIRFDFMLPYMIAYAKNAYAIIYSDPKKLNPFDLDPNGRPFESKSTR